MKSDSLSTVSLGMVALFVAAGAAADTFIVDSFQDEVDDDLVNISCHTDINSEAAGKCTLRAAVMQANRMPNDSTIVLRGGTYTLTRLPSGANGDDLGDLNLTAPTNGSGAQVIAISGSGPDSTIIDAGHLDRVFFVEPGRTASISGVTLRNGSAVEGGAIYNEGSLTVRYCTLSGNAAGLDGGAIYHWKGSLTLSNSALSGNSTGSVGLGGGLYSFDNAYVSQTTISGNAASYGGGIFNQGVLYLTNSTISGNTANGDGGGIYSQSGQTWTYNATIVGNLADADAEVSPGGNGGGIFNFNDGPAAVYLRNTVVAGNRATGYGYLDDCSGSVGTFGRNKFSSLGGCTVIRQNVNGDDTEISSLAELGPLQFNGGSTRTHALMPGSSMIDGANATEACQGQPIDQRGGARGLGALCDLGAFEYGALPAGLLFADGFESGNLWAW